MLPSKYPEVNNYPAIKYIFSKQIDMLFNDLRCMFKSPLPGCGAGYNLSIGIVILSIFAGFSRKLYRPSKSLNDNERFISMLSDFFPWVEDFSPNPRECSELLYVAVRNPLIHNLGLDNKSKYKGIILIKSGKSSDEEIAQLEDSVSSPSWLPVNVITYAEELSEYHVSVTGLYWGLHRLLHNLLSDSDHALKAEEQFKQKIKKT